MTISTRAKFWTIVTIIVICSFIGGIFGNWSFIYILDKYYGIPNGNYLSGSSLPNITLRNPQKNNSEQPLLTSLVADSKGSMVGIFKRSNEYLSKNKLGQGLILTSDGWLMSTMLFPDLSANALSQYAVIANDKKIYEIDRVVTDPLTHISFIHLTKASNLPVRDFVSSYDLNPGQEILAMQWNGKIEVGVVGGSLEDIRSSETPFNSLEIIDVESKDKFLFDFNGRIAGFSYEEKFFDMDGVQAFFKKVLMSGTIAHARLGVYYINLSNVPVESEEGAMIIANDKKISVVKGSPADKAGLLTGDIISTLDKEKITGKTDIASLLQKYNPGETVTITYIRSKESKNVQVKLDQQVIQ
jgi:S1-C subfamily serine protease